MVTSGVTRPMPAHTHVPGAVRRCFAGNTILFDNLSSERMRPRST